ncbi:MAG: Tetratricopeptide 4 [Sphingomonas bacterium]|uniref:hypothetical protein n=1 Tax=Sphingomonas bacterium TaxID=1895847 RepID=UPI00260E10D3|nr:hypothetical protein [Sphingomonas bacterium]MDB5704449.1 Tetratricopeptide 4 [Sphingomonas bacterium]
MKSALCFGLFAMLVAGAGASLANASAIKASEASHLSVDTVQQVMAAYEKGDCDSALALLGPLLKDARAAGGPEEVLGWGYGTAASCSYHLGRMEDARRLVLDGTALAPSNEQLWKFRFGLDLEQKRSEDAVVTVEAIAAKNTGAFDVIPRTNQISLIEMLRSGHQSALERRALEVLTSDAFKPDLPFSEKDHFRKLYVQMLYDEGNKARALDMVRAVTDPSVLNELSFDPRFAATMPADFDMRSVVERSLADAQEKMRQHPDLVEPIVMVTLRLRQLGRPQEALVLLEASKTKMSRDNGFADAQEQRNWWWNSLSRTYRMLGQYDDAAGAMLAGASVKEQGQLNVSQVINLAYLQVRFGKAQDALKTLAPFDKPGMATNPYGMMAMRTIRACATARVSGAQAAAADIAYARAHDTDNRNAVSEMMLCIGDVDGAAAALIHQLEDPERTGFTLAQLSDFDDPPVALPLDPADATLKKAKLRADVKAAIARAGKTRRIHLQQGEL